MRGKSTVTAGVTRPSRTGSRYGALTSPTPRPVRDGQTVRDIVCGSVKAGHRGGGRPRKVFVQRLSEPLVVGKADVCQRLIEAGDRSMVHLVVRAVPAVHPHDRRFVAVLGRERHRPTQRLRPVGGEPLGVLGVKSVAECMADHSIGHHPGMPRAGQAQQAIGTARSLVHRLHDIRIALRGAG